MSGLRIAFAGTPEFAVPALRALVESRHTVVGALTQPDRPSGRGRKITASAVKEEALKSGLPVAQPLTLRTEDGRAPLAAFQPDVLVVVAYGLILPREVLELPPLGCVNIHASLLPRWRGAAPIQRAILAGDAETGVTIMKLDVGLDTGPMLLQRRVTIGTRETSGELHGRLAVLGAPALLEALEGLAAGRLKGEPQSADGVTYAAKIAKSEALIDWTRDAISIERQVRAFDPWPIAETRFAGEPLKIIAASANTALGEGQGHGSSDEARGQLGRNSKTESPKNGSIDSMARQSGEIIGVQNSAIQVACGRGILAITTLQRPGRRPVSAMDFAHSCALTGLHFG